jgi:hypothetical protein
VVRAVPVKLLAVMVRSSAPAAAGDNRTASRQNSIDPIFIIFLLIKTCLSWPILSDLNASAYRELT